MATSEGSSEQPEVPWYAPEEPLPPYSYVDGKFPHPIRDPAGHSFGVEPRTVAAPDPNRWQDCGPYLYGLDLFNRGYYWEAHEVWEGVWHACGRSGLAADFFKGLIKLAAAGVKVREGRPEGVRRHARRAAELFQNMAGQLATAEEHYFGLSLPILIENATDMASKPPTSNAPAGTPVEVVFDFALRPQS